MKSIKIFGTLAILAFTSMLLLSAFSTSGSYAQNLTATNQSLETNATGANSSTSIMSDDSSGLEDESGQISGRGGGRR